MSPHLAARRARRSLEEADILLFPEALRAEVTRALDVERSAQPRRARGDYHRLMRAVADQPSLVSCLARWVGRTYVDEGLLEDAERHFEQSRALAEVVGSRRGVAMATNLLAIAAQLTGRIDEAKAKYREVRRYARKAGEPQLLAMVEQNLGTLASIEGRYEEARAHMRRSVRLYREIGLDAKAWLALNNLGLVHAALGDYELARRAYRRALRGCRRLGDRAAAFRIRINLAETLIRMGETARALRICARVLSAARGDELAAAPWTGEAYKGAGTAHRLRGERERARWCLEEALRIAVNRRDPLLEAESARELAELFMQEQRNREALELLNRAHMRFVELHARHEVAGIAERLALFEARFLEIVRGWGRSMEVRDPYTQGHCERVAELATRLAERCGFPAEMLFWFRIGALLHDIGKLQVPLEVLNKRGALTAAERAVIEQHPADGERMLSSIEFPWDIRPLVRSHHERWDGRGYPDQLAGDHIPLSARILSIADVYDALTTSRSYRPAFAPADALAIMREERGTRFDPVLLDRFLEMSATAAKGEREAA